MPTRHTKLDNGKRRGLGVDAYGGEVVDPTANVIALSEASNRRQDDLRQETNRRIDVELACVKELSELRSRHMQEMALLRAEHVREMGIAETNRLNAIRQVDVSAVRTEADRALTAIQTLANSTTSNAEVLRNLVSTTAQALATQLTQTVAAITERIAVLEKSSYEGQGQRRVADPMMSEMVAEMKALRVAQSVSAGKGEGFSAGWGYLLGAVTLVSMLYAFLKP